MSLVYRRKARYNSFTVYQGSFRLGKEHCKMSEKRRDSKNRILQTGESQRKDGRYAYKYVDTFGKSKFLYAWKLVPTDKTPAGKRDGLSLREKEKELQKDLDDGIDPVGKKMTVCELYAKRIRQNGNVKPKTKLGRQHLMNLLHNDELGRRSIDSVKMSDGKEWVIRMKENGFAYKTIRNYKRSLNAAFYMAIQDDYIRKNPFDFDIRDVIENDTIPKEALTAEQEKAFTSFVQNDKTYQKYYNEIIILLGTGLRISELCGLTDYDLDFENKIISIDHQLLKLPDVGYYIDKPKTKRGIRQIKMSEEVYQAFRRVLLKRKNSDFGSGFIFLNDNGEPKTVTTYDDAFKAIRKKYKKFGNEIMLPNKLTPHTLRHTFCTNMANAGMNPKALQYIMGHASITMTLNYYAHATFESAKAEMERIVA